MNGPPKRKNCSGAVGKRRRDCEPGKQARDDDGISVLFRKITKKGYTHVNFVSRTIKIKSCRCSQLEACVVEIRSLLEEQKTTVKSLREEVDKAHGDAEKAKNQVPLRHNIIQKYTPLDSAVSYVTGKIMSPQGFRFPLVNFGL